MDIQGIGSTLPVYDRETFGAAVVGKTLDYMHGRTTPGAQAFDRETFGAAVVSTTLDYLNTTSDCCKQDNSYTFQNDVLMPAYTGRGTFLDKLA